MCGRYLIDDEAFADILMIMSANTEIMNSALQRSNSTLNKGDVYPASIAPVITDSGTESIKWGFPHWKRSGVIINARAETALQKSMFRKPLLERRCVIPSGGFYEWNRTGNGKKKDKFLLRLPDARILYMAGMINIFTDADGALYSAFVIITTAANNSVSAIHDRMPVILAADERDRWLTDDGFMESILQRPGPLLITEPQ